ncbi:hypothetical protein IWX49DRAFT_550247 [Phyllosticta citricarpa]
MLSNPPSEGTLVAAEDAGPPAAPNTPQDSESKPQDEYRRRVAAKITASLLASGENANLVFKLRDGHTAKAHKSIVCANCQVLANILHDEPQDSVTTVEMPGGSRTSLKAMLGFLYTSSTSPAQRVLEHLEILVIGHTCELPALQSIAEPFETALKQESVDLWLIESTLVREVYLESWRANTRIRQLLVEKTVENLPRASEEQGIQASLGNIYNVRLPCSPSYRTEARHGHFE